MIIVSINRKPSTGEYLVTSSGPELKHPETYYADDLEDAVHTAFKTLDDWRSYGYTAELSTAKATLNFVSRYSPAFLIEETKRVTDRIHRSLS